MREYEVVIIWYNGEKNIYDGFPTEDDAAGVEKGFHVAFGNQISWSCVREKLR
jgi:hypothetical protein